MSEIFNRLRTTQHNLKNPFRMLIGAFWFTLENYRKRYPYILLGEKKIPSSSDTHKETILLYRISGKRYVFECSAEVICNSKELISKFHPLDVRIISYIAGIEQVLKTNAEERKVKFEKLKEYIFTQ